MDNTQNPQEASSQPTPVINVRLVSNQGAGSRQVVQVTSQITVAQLIEQYIGSGQNLLIRVDGKPVGTGEGQVNPSTPLTADCQVSTSPRKIEGAAVGRQH